jgi:hypothetical protein
MSRLVLACLCVLVGCGSAERRTPDDVVMLPDGGAVDGAADDAGSSADAGLEPPLVDSGLVLNELMSSNDGVWVDELGEVDDWVELANRGAVPIELAGFSLMDESGAELALPSRTLAPGERIVLWADEEPEQGELHLPFKLSKDGDSLLLKRIADGATADRVAITALETNESFVRLPDGQGEWTRCRYATPGRDNGAACSPPWLGGLEEDAVFAPYSWPASFPQRSGPLAITELALRPAAFIELKNLGSEPVALAAFALSIAPHRPGQPWPDVTDGLFVDFPLGAVVAPGELFVVEVTDAHVAELAADPRFEGVVSLHVEEGLGARAVERVDFVDWPSGAVLSRGSESGPFRYCKNASEAAEDACQPLESRAVGDRLRALATPADFAALAQGATSVGVAPVKFVVDMQAGDQVHLLSAERWPLHFAFTREVIDGRLPLDRCDPAEGALFQAAFSAFIATEYYTIDTRRYLLGTLAHHVGADVYGVEFTHGDLITAEQMKRAFFAVTSRVEQPERWFLHPRDDEQVRRAREIEGELPIMGPNAPYRNLRFQPLTPTVGYGRLTFVPSGELSFTPLGHDVIVVTDDVPNDIPLVGGLITEAFQTPLSHVNLLSQARDTPNMALRDARLAPELAELFGEVVRLEVATDGFHVAKADPAEAQAFWDARAPDGPAFEPALDLSLRGPVSLGGRSIADLPAIGAKAAQLAEISRASVEREDCQALPIAVPEQAFAIPVAHYRDHFSASGAEAKLASLQADPGFASDPMVREAGLAELRGLIQLHPVDADLLASVKREIEVRFAGQRVRFRSSSNAEDLEGFNGAGLYTSASAELDDAALSVEDALRTVWASLWELRAYDERSYARIAHDKVAMGVLVHPAFRGEKANGVAMSRNLNDVTRGDQFYINVQVGEASVANPAPGVGTEELLYTWPPVTPELSVRSRSTLTGGAPILAPGEVREVACALGALHDHFKGLFDPDDQNRWFTIEVEFKLVGDGRQLMIKQARPFPFSTTDLPSDCR